MDTTIRLLPLLETLAASTDTTPTLEQLRNTSLAPTNDKVVGALVWFLTSTERISRMESWADESPVAQDLARFGHVTWANSAVLELMRPAGKSRLATQQLHGQIEASYLAAMAVARRAVQPRYPDAELFVERLRVLVLVRALEASLAGIPRELHIEQTCIALRQAADREFSPHWSWIRRISHTEDGGLNDFVLMSIFRCEEALDPGANPPLTATEKHALVHLKAVLSSNREAPASTNWQQLRSAAAPARLTPCDLSRTNSPTPFPELLSSAAANSLVSAADEAGENQAVLVSEVDPKRPPRAQRAQGTGLILQSIEDSQFLRHSWHRLSGHETPAFLARLAELGASEEPLDQLGTALVGIAAATSVPLSGISRIRIQGELSGDWTVDLRRGALRRQPPRPSHRWKAEPASNAWVQTKVGEWKITLPDSTVATLRRYRGNRANSLRAIWESASPQMTLEHWFGSRFAVGEVLSRLTSPVVSSILAQSFFEANQDHAEARLLTSSRRSAIPAACTYGSFRLDEVRRTWDRGLPPELGSMLAMGSSAHSNAAGSELDVDLTRLRAAIEKLTRRVNETALDGSDWVTHHNLLTALCVVTLFASTGARPVRSPFESIRWFDFDRQMIYVEDKRSGPTQGARLCVLSDIAHRLVTERYILHLDSLRQAMGLKEPGFARRLMKVAGGDAECDLPLFFFLRAPPEFDWIEVSGTQLDIICANPWPLPWNLFRHLHSTYLRRNGLPAEVRDALLSHGEAGAESHGAGSWRTPSDDIAVARPHVNALADRLGLTLPRKAVPPLITLTRLSMPEPVRNASFGRQARELRRDKVHASAKRAAQADIDRKLDKRPPDSLSATEWEEIARSMIVREDGEAHPMGSLRAEAFEDYLAQLWRDKRVRVDARRRYLPIQEGRAWFDEDVIAASREVSKLRVELDKLSEGLTREPLPDLAGCLAALELALHCSVSNYAVLAAVICNLPSVNVVRFLDRYWLEYAYHGEWVDGRPVYRVPITARAAGWVALRKTAKKKHKSLPIVPTALTGCFSGTQSGRLSEILARVCGWVAQANALELPGAIAAVLRGTQMSAALPHSDWVRTTFLHAPVLGGTCDSPVDPPTEDQTHFLATHGRALDMEGTNDAARCASLFDAIQEVLIQPRGTATREMASDISQLLKRSGFSKGSAPFVLVHYVHHLLTRSKKTDPTKTLKSSTALRYWYALKPGMLDFAYDVHLPALDDEELTELYQQIVKAAEAPPDEVVAGSSKRRTLKPDSDASRRTFEELWSFHEFARDIYGLDEPDWSEVSPGICGGSGRPGLVLMAEYEAVLATFAAAGACDALDSASLSAAFVLVACARFGLRIGEAAGMSYGDWIDVDGAIVALVRSNATRGLKTDAAKRQVPLVGQLNALEKAVVAEVRRRWVLREDPQKLSAGLLPDVGSNTFRAQKNRIAKRLLPLIKRVTGNDSSTVHHLRHGFACRLLTLLHGYAYGPGLSCDDQSTRSTRRLLLQADSPDRRTLWAVARCLGHASAAGSTLPSYVHVLDQWIPKPLDRSSLVPIETLGFVDLDARPREDLISRLKPIKAVVESTPEPLFRRYVQYLRLRALRHRNPGEVTRLSAEEQQHLENTLLSVAHRLIGKSSPDAGQLLVGRVREKRWQELSSLAGAVRTPPPALSLSSWLPTIGTSHQIVLFHAEHFDWMAQFVKALSLQVSDCALVYRHEVDVDILSLASGPVLHPLLSPSRLHGPTFQLDVAAESAPKRVFSDRLVMIPRTGGRLAAKYELLLLWIAWLAAG